MASKRSYGGAPVVAQQPLMYVGEAATDLHSLWLYYLGAMEMKVRRAGWHHCHKAPRVARIPIRR